jgi:hypothetical protein
LIQNLLICSWALNGRLNGAITGHLIDLRRSTRGFGMFGMALQFRNQRTSSAPRRSGAMAPAL